ncbi:MAG: hypothetical protein GF309_05505 [Candidatus Lokiarchaeota archaeon]|nr:hypothetical protein [Candidatus Lokiarchaeota archaeon]
MIQNKPYSAIIFFIFLISLGSPILKSTRTWQGDSEAAFSRTPSDSLFGNNPLMPEESPQTTPKNPGHNLFTESSIGNEEVIEEGILDALDVEQRGYTTPGILAGRTDTGIGTSYAFPLDEEHDWVASMAELEVWNLTRLYAVNGSFIDGIPGPNVNPNGSVAYRPFGWDATSYEPEGYNQTQVAAYDDSDTGYVVVENQGERQGANNKQVHAAGTYVIWNQTLRNLDHVDEAFLSFRYLYLRGPLGDLNQGSCFIRVLIDDTAIWNVSLLDVGDRGVWNSTGRIPVNLTELSSSANLKIGLFIDETMELKPEDQGIENAVYITTYLDDLSLYAKNPPSFSEVSLEYKVGENTTSVIGSNGEGFASISFEDYVTSGPVDVAVISNTSVSFLHQPRLLSHKFDNSSWTTDFEKKGVAYSIAANQSSNLTLYTYLGTREEYENFSLVLYHPIDWMNPRVYDPFLVEVSDQCIVQEGRLEVPQSVLNRLGWWLVSFSSPNYVETFCSQIRNEKESYWSNTTSYATGNLTRVLASLGSEYKISSNLENLHFRWRMPNGTIWYNTTVDSSSPVSAPTQGLRLSGSNTTAGQWRTELFWTNGTELALSSISFTLRHIVSIEPIQPIIETEVGETINVLVRLEDADNGDLIMTGPTTVTMEWAESTYEFVPNILRNWWEASVDTSVRPAGSYMMNVSVSSPYFWDTFCTIELQSVFSTDLNSPEGPIEPLVFGRPHSFTFSYSLKLNGSNIRGANISVSQFGTGDYDVEEAENGLYNLTIIPGNLGNQSLVLTFKKEGCESQYYIFTYLVVRVPIQVSIESSLVGVEGDSIDLEIKVTESDTGEPVTNATVVYGIFPAVGDSIETGSAEESSPGSYLASITIPTSDSNGYRLRVQVEKANFESIDDFSAELVSLVNQQARLVYYGTRIGGILAFLAISGVVYTLYRRKKNAEYQEALAVKRRFEDASDLIGIIVLHKDSGLPVYSKILKGGFDESVISAFITAISHFRSEFDSESMEAKWKILPISDIIRAVETENLICAFITVSKPSEIQEDRMKQFAIAVGDAIDDLYEDRPTKAEDESVTNLIDTLFDSTLDGHLLKYYKRGTSEEFPGRYKCLEEVLEGTESHCAKPSYLTRSMSKCGVNEPKASKLVMEAIDKDLLISCQPDEANDHSFALDWEL